jgi:hypothetical protein
MDKTVLSGIRIGVWWTVGVGSLLSLIQGIGTISKISIVILGILCIGGFCLASIEHGWVRRPWWKAALILAFIAVAVLTICCKVWPPKEAIKITPTITWFPSSIKEGELFSASQLNAIALVDGVPIDGDYLYNPSPGATAYPSGNITASVSFTPINHIYNSASRTVTVGVIPKPKLAPEHPNLQASFNGANLSIPVKTATLSRVPDGSFGFAFVVRNFSNMTATHLEIWVKLCDQCKAVVARGFDRSAGTPENTLHISWPEISGGAGFGLNGVNFFLPPDYVGDTVPVSFAVGCDGCGKVQFKDGYRLTIPPKP